MLKLNLHTANFQKEMELKVLASRADTRVGHVLGQKTNYCVISEGMIMIEDVHNNYVCTIHLHLRSFPFR